MKIGLISDTHGDYMRYSLAMDILKDCDFFLHAGDVLSYNIKLSQDMINDLQKRHNMYIARGNGDNFNPLLIGKESLPYDMLLNFKTNSGNIIIYLTHSHKFYFEDIIEKAKDAGAGFIVYGHTHIKKLEKYKDLIIINPGSVSRPRDGVRSCGKIDTALNTAYLIDIDKNEIISELKY